MLPIKEKRKFNVIGNCIKDNYERYIPSIFDEFLLGEYRKSDIYFLLNQKRIDKNLNASTVEAYFDKLHKLQPESIFSHLDDEQRFDMIKSRRITSFSDLYTYSKNLTHEAKQMRSKIDKEVADEMYQKKLRYDYDNLIKSKKKGDE